MSTASDNLQAFKRHMAFKLRSAKDHIQTLSQLLKHERFMESPRDAVKLYQERALLVEEVVELQAVMDYLRDFEAELAYDARTAAMLEGS